MVRATPPHGLRCPCGQKQLSALRTPELRRSEWENIKWSYRGDGTAWSNWYPPCHVAKWAEDRQHSKHCRPGVSAWRRASADNAVRLLAGQLFL